MKCRSAVILLAIAWTALAMGCRRSADSPGAGYTPDSRERLIEIGSMYKAYTTDHRDAPRKLSDFDPYEPANQGGFAWIRDGACVMLWGGKPPEAGSSAVVLAYEAKVPHEGGLVLMQDGTVVEMNAAQFGAAPKAGEN